MKNKLWILASVTITLVLIGLVIADVYVSKKIISSFEGMGNGAAALTVRWQLIQTERISRAFFAGIVLVMIGIIVVKIGVGKQLPGGISQSEAQKIADDLMMQYRKNGIYVEAKEDNKAGQDA